MVEFPGLTRFVIVLRALIIGVGDFAAGILVGWNAHWHSSTSLTKISHLGLPWPVIGGWLIAAAALTAYPKTRAIGYGMTSVIFFVAAWSLAEVSIDAPLANGLAVVGLFMLAAILLCGVATAQTDRGRRDAP